MNASQIQEEAVLRSLSTSKQLKFTYPVKVVIIGSGWIGRALAKRFADANVNVVIGSRSPSERLESKFEVVCDIINTEDACLWGDLIILAVPHTSHSSMSMILKTTAYGKVIVDCSNRPPGKSTTSVAEELQLMLPCCQVVKAFNDTSAYELSRTSGGGASEKTLRYCGDDEASKDMLRGLMDRIGANSRDVGVLKSARNLEAFTFQFFEDWRAAMYIAAPSFIFIVCYTPKWYVNRPGGNPYVFTKQFVTISGHYSLFLMGMVYLPGTVAAVHQLAFGTAGKAFPRWLSGWMSMRKHLGLIALWFALYHVLASCFINVPVSFYDVGDSGVEKNMNRYDTR